MKGDIMRYQKFLPLLFFFALITTGIETDVSLASFPQISKHFSVSEGVVQLTIAYNFLGFCIGALIYGPLSDCYGRRKIMILGNALMLIGALGCIITPSIEFLLAARFIQGIGASASIVLVFAMIAEVYPFDKAMKLIALMNAGMSSSMALAPILGGFINDAFAWRGNYSFVGILCFVNLALICLFMPETKKELDSKISVTKILADYKQLFLNLKFICASLIPSLLCASYMVFVASSSFLYMGTFSLSTMEYVTHQAIVVASFAVTSLFTNKLIQILGPIQIVRLGVFLCVLGSIIFMGISNHSAFSAYFMTAFISLFCVGFAICYPVIFSESLSIFPNLRGTTSSFNMSVRSLLVFLFTGLSSLFYNQQAFTVSVVIFCGVGISLLFYLISIRFKKNIAQEVS
ncbi:MAG: MFS transporter [Spirobacillus cienkowskii]|uniref:MFS transporter n=2 Tax=Spirobacillus cienkowskii TaxID=495820 RepID=A0A369KXD7_9BACT|nr:MAG: MFS transporter [Spirobacillus cienkowskii]